MNKNEYKNAIALAQGDADKMMDACVQRIYSLEELVGWAETLLCNSLPMDHCSLEEWNETIKKWRDEKNGVNTTNSPSNENVDDSPSWFDLLKTAKCPNCDGSGAIPVQTGSRQYVTREMALDAECPEMEGSLYTDNTWEPEQCKWCYERQRVVDSNVPAEPPVVSDKIQQDFGVCNSPFHPEWNGLPCQCVNCRPVGYCVEDPCLDCAGPVDGCQPPDEDNTNSQIESDNLPYLSDRLRTWINMEKADAAHPAYTIQLMEEAADMIDMIDRECSLCKSYHTLPDRVPWRIKQHAHRFRWTKGKL